MADALQFGMVVHSGEGAEYQLPPRPVLDIHPNATAGNILTGETYDPAEFSITLALVFCPWCATRLIHSAPPWCARPNECVRPFCDCDDMDAEEAEVRARGEWIDDISDGPED